MALENAPAARDLQQPSTSSQQTVVQASSSSAAGLTARFSGSTGALLSGSNIGLSRSATGTYTGTFTGLSAVPLVHVSYVVSGSNVALCAPSVFSLTSSGFSLEVFDRGGTKVDVTELHISVFVVS